MITLRPYSAYKSSGIDWVSEIPAHWQLAKLGRIAVARSGGTPPMERRDYWEPEVPWVSSKDMKTSRLSDSQMWVSRSSIADGKTALTLPGSILLVVRSGILRHTIPIAVVDREVAFNQDIKALQLRSDSMTADYFANLIRGNQSSFLTMWSKQGATVESLELPWIMETPVPIPPLPEQRAITDFLDVADARITRYIAAKRRMISLLEEQKQAIINQAVTRGLDPDVPLKPSGVDWLGDIPAHWEVTKLGRYIHLLTGFPFKSEEFSTIVDDIRLLRGINVVPNSIRWESVVRWSQDRTDEVTEYMLDAGEIVLGMDRPIVGNGVRVAVLGESDVPSLLLQRVACIRPTASLTRNHLVRLLQSSGFYAYLEPIFTGISVPHLSPEQIRSFPVTLPPLGEQQEIAEYLHEAVTRVDSAKNRNSREIELVQEYRTRLISDVVTGKLDVRGVELPALEDVIGAYLIAAEVAESTVAHGGVATR